MAGQSCSLLGWDPGHSIKPNAPEVTLPEGSQPFSHHSMTKQCPVLPSVSGPPCDYDLQPTGGRWQCVFSEKDPQELGRQACNLLETP